MERDPGYPNNPCYDSVVKRQLAKPAKHVKIDTLYYHTNIAIVNSQHLQRVCKAHRASNDANQNEDEIRSTSER